MEPTTSITLLPLLVYKINFLFTLQWQQAVSIWLNKDEWDKINKSWNIGKFLIFDWLQLCI